MRGEQDHGQRRVARTHLVEQREPVAPRQLHVAQDQLRALYFKLCEGGFGRADGRHLEARGLQAQGQQAQHVCVVIHHQDAGFDRGGGFVDGHGDVFRRRSGRRMRPATGTGRAARSRIQAALDGAHGFQPLVELLVAALGVAQLLGLPVELVFEPAHV